MSKHIVPPKHEGLSQNAGPQRILATRTSSDVIGCQHCQIDDEGNLLIGQEVMVLDVPGLTACPSCQAALLPEDIVAVGIGYVRRRSPEGDDV